MKTRTTYIIGLAVGLGILLLASSMLGDGRHFGTVGVFCGGFAIGWISAYVRFVYIERVDEKSKSS